MIHSTSSISRLPSPKRKAYSITINSSRPAKRRSSKACQCCRARKVRCNVVEYGAPCTNCRLDNVPCIVIESRNRKPLHSLVPSAKDSADTGRCVCGGAGVPAHKHLHLHHHQHPFSAAEGFPSFNLAGISHGNFFSENPSVGPVDQEDELAGFQMPQYPNQMAPLTHFASANPFSLQPSTSQNLIFGFAADLLSSPFETNPLFSASTLEPRPQQLARQLTNGLLPAYIKPLNPRVVIEDVGYLWKKGALTIPDPPFRNALLSAYIEFVHPYMPLIELNEFLRIVSEGTGKVGRVSLLLFQAVMFTAVAFVDMSYLTAAGYSTRRAARKTFYLKPRVLYDFDYESDRVAIVQSLLLMSYWYETPDDQKDSWHWMGVAISLAHTIGLHRNSARTVMPPQKKKLWKRIWWSCFMRDQLIGLSMRRPTRIKDADFDVPMLKLEDFETTELPAHILPSCSILRDAVILSDLAHLCIAKAKLCLCISQVLGAQYSVLIRDQSQATARDENTRNCMMLFPKKLDQTDKVRACNVELADWLLSLPKSCLYRTPTTADLDAGQASLVVQRALLHMCYHATLSALHRPQVLPSAETATQTQCHALQHISHRQVREASREITRAAQSLFQLQLARYLPTTGVTVLLPAIIIHLLDIKTSSCGVREEARRGFVTCMRVLELLRDSYAAADFATQFLAAAMRKAGIEVAQSYAAEAAANARESLTPPVDSTATSAFWEVDGTSVSVIGAEVTTPPDVDLDVYMMLGGISGEEDSVSKEQFEALVDCGEGEKGEGEWGDAWTEWEGYNGDWGRDGVIMEIGGGMEYRGAWGK